MGAVFRPTAARTNTAITDPVVTSDAAAGFRVGDWWFNSATGNAFYATDVTAGAAVWKHVPRRLAGSAVAATAPADTNENILATVTIPAGAMGLNGRLRVHTVWTVNNNANVKAARVRLGGIGGTDFLGANVASTLSMQNQVMIANRNAANSQVGFCVGTTPFALVNAANVTAAIDTSASTTLVITAAKATAGDTMTLESYLVELMLP